MTQRKIYWVWNWAYRGLFVGNHLIGYTRRQAKKRGW